LSQSIQLLGAPARDNRGRCRCRRLPHLQTLPAGNTGSHSLSQKRSTEGNRRHLPPQHFFLKNSANQGIVFNIVHACAHAVAQDTIEVFDGCHAQHAPTRERMRRIEFGLSAEINELAYTMAPKSGYICSTHSEKLSRRWRLAGKAGKPALRQLSAAQRLKHSATKCE